MVCLVFPMTQFVEFKQSSLVCADTKQGIYLAQSLQPSQKFWNGRGIEAFNNFANQMQELFGSKFRVNLILPTLNVLADESLDQVSMVAMSTGMAKLNYCLEFIDKFAVLNSEANSNSNVLGFLEFDDHALKFWINQKLHLLSTTTDVAMSNIISDLSLKSGLALNAELAKKLISSFSTKSDKIYLNAKNSAGELVVWEPEANVVNKIVETAYFQVAKQIAAELKPLLAAQEGVVSRKPKIVVIGTTTEYRSLLKLLQAELGVALEIPEHSEYTSMSAALKLKPRRKYLQNYRLNKLEIY